MSANLNYDANGNASVAYKGATPWHREGQKLESAFTAEEAIKAANLDWEVECRPVYHYTDGEDGYKAIEIEERKAVVRTDTNEALGIVGNRYAPLQNREAFGFFDGLFGEGNCRFETAGALGKGERIWLLAKMDDNDPMEVVMGDVVDKYMCLTTAHDGSGSVLASFTPIRIVCGNTCSMFIRDIKKADKEGVQSFVRIKHTGEVANRVKAAGDILRTAGIFYDEAKMVFQKFAKADMTVGATKNYVARVLLGAKAAEKSAEWTTRSRNTVNSVMDLVDGGLGTEIPGVRGTLWGAYNGLTEYADHKRDYRGTKDAEGRVDTRKRFEAAQFGAGRELKERAFTIGRELVEKTIPLKKMELN
jgi:phage/plasmid-like protein (TIGR03299 family)